MKIYQLKRTQFLPISLEQAWDFFATPKNLAVITPPSMKFQILSQSGADKMYAGQIIRYKVSVKPWLKVNWVTEITHVNEPFYFVDDQVSGPYSLWHHQHHFKEVAGGVEMTDELHYAIPFGLLGRLVNALFVAREVNTIFDYRFNILKTHFNQAGTPVAV
ncbi:MAG TPA: SRPBCC family protein [Chryseosolibacter sp.]